MSPSCLWCSAILIQARFGSFPSSWKIKTDRRRGTMRCMQGRGCVTCKSGAMGAACMSLFVVPHWKFDHYPYARKRQDVELPFAGVPEDSNPAVIPREQRLYAPPCGTTSRMQRTGLGFLVFAAFSVAVITLAPPAQCYRMPHYFKVCSAAGACSCFCHFILSRPVADPGRSASLASRSSAAHVLRCFGCAGWLRRVRRSYRQSDCTPTVA